MKRTDTKTLITAARLLARDIQSGDGVANAALAEIADRLEELDEDRKRLDWMEKNGCSEFERWSTGWGTDKHDKDTLRLAIDTEISKP